MTHRMARIGTPVPNSSPRTYQLTAVATLVPAMPRRTFAGAATCGVAVFAAIIVASSCPAALADNWKEGRVNPVLASSFRKDRGNQICKHSLKKKWGLDEPKLQGISDDKLCGKMWADACSSWFPST